MSLFIRVDCSFFRHRKTIKLRASLGDDALWVPPALWAYAAEHQQDGDFKDYSDKELALAIGYSKDAQALLQALLQALFLDKDRKIHDWAEHNGYHMEHRERAKKAASARWSKFKPQSPLTLPVEEREDKIRGEESARVRGSAPSIAPSIAPSTIVAEGLIGTVRLRLDVLFKRDPKAAWGNDEEHYLCDVARRTDVLAELSEIEAFYQFGTYRPTKLGRLLEDWPGVLDRARNHYENIKRNRPKTFDRSAGTFMEGKSSRYSRENREKLSPVPPPNGIQDPKSGA